MSTEDTPTVPVRVELHAAWPGGHADQSIEIPRSEWEAMTPQQRADLCERDAVGFLTDQNVSSGYTVLGDDAGSEQDDQQPTSLPGLSEFAGFFLTDSDEHLELRYSTSDDANDLGHMVCRVDLDMMLDELIREARAHLRRLVPVPMADTTSLRKQIAWAINQIPVGAEMSGGTVPAAAADAVLAVVAPLLDGLHAVAAELAQLRAAVIAPGGR